MALLLYSENNYLCISFYIVNFKYQKPYLVKERLERFESDETRLTANIKEANEFKQRVKDASVKIISETISEDGNSAEVIMEIFIKG